MNDVRFAVRGFARTPGFTTIAVLTLALGIGATTAIFSVVNAVLLKPLPFSEPDRLVVARISIPDYRDVQSSIDAFDGTALWASNLYNLRIGGETQQVLSAMVTDTLLPLLGVRPVLGRNFGADEADAVILGYGLWQSRFGGDPSILGKTIDLSGFQFNVVGVAPAWFRFPSSEFQLYAPLRSIETGAPAQAKNRGLRIFSMLARLEPGATLQQAQSQATAQSELLARTYPDTNAQVAITFEPLYERLVGQARPGLRVLLTTVSLLLLIACANVANLMLARTTARDRELAIRAALGAARGRLVRQVLTESVLLALVGGALGLLVAAWGVDALPALVAERLPRAETIRVDSTVLLFALAASVVAAACFGIVPALHATGAEAIGSLKAGSRSLAGSRRGRKVRSAIAVAEIALAVAVVVGASLLVRSFLTLTSRDPGITIAGLTSFNVQLATLKDGASRVRAAQDVLERVSALPGVVSVGAATGLPLVTPQRATRFDIEGRTLSPEESSALFIAVTPGYFQALDAPVRRGRAVERIDVADAPPIALINETLANALFPGEDPVGRRLRLVNREHSAEWRTIAGVVGDIKYRGLDRDTAPTVYTSFYQTPFPWLYFQARTDDSGIAPAIRRAVAAAHPSLTAANIRPMTDVAAGTVAEPRFQVLLVSSFAALALVLAAIGIYGVISYSVAQRTREIGVRMALGAASGHVLGLVIREGVVLAAAGIALGLLGSALLAGVMRTVLVGVAPRDPLSFGAAAVVLLTVAALASWLPARRALRVDPIRALRAD